MPRCSIVIPTYNQAGWLAECLESVLAQTFEDFEAIVVNNHSEDHTKEVVGAVADRRVRLVNFDNQGVIAASRNKGVRLAQGEWIAFLDSDDLWMPTKLAECLDGIDQETNLICHQAERFRGGKTLGLTRPVHPKQMHYRVMLFEGNCLTPTTTLVKREALEAVGGFSEEKEWITVEDYDLWLRLAQEGIKARILNKPLARYRLHHANSSSNVLLHFEAARKLLEHHYDGLELKGKEEARALTRAVARQTYGAARQFQDQGHIKEALSFFAQSFRLNPWQFKLYVATAQALLGQKG